MSERREAANWEEDEAVEEEGDSWLEDDEADEAEFGSLHPFIKSCVPGSTNEIDYYHHLRRHSDDNGLNRTHSFDPNLFDIRHVPYEKLAEQMTLIDLVHLKAIKRQELLHCSWTKKNKHTQAPNICNFSQRFNHTSFLVQREILNQANLKIRAEVVAIFIRVAKKLHELNNLHSLVSVVLSLRSPPIMRLSQTWKHVHRKDRTVLDKLEEFLSEEENNKRLRDHMSSLKLPCIPHLGMYLKDLVYLDARASLSSSEQQQETITKETEAVLKVIADCQESDYDHLVPDIPIQTYLKSVRFIEELQRFHEDENYKLSHQREPDEQSRSKPSLHLHPLRASKSTEDLMTPLKPEVTGPAAAYTRPLSPQCNRHKFKRSIHSSSVIEHTSRRILDPPTIEVGGSPDLPGRKVVTLPAGLHGFGGKNNGKSGGELLSQKPASPATRRGHMKSRSLGTNVLAMLGVTGRSPRVSRKGSPDPPVPVSLLDDSFLNDTFVSSDPTAGSTEFFNPSMSTASSSSGANGDDREEENEEFIREEESEIPTAPDPSDVTKEGLLKCKVVSKQGSRVSFKMKTKYCVQLTQRSLFLMPSKYKKSKKTTKLKCIKLRGCHVRHKDPATRLKDKKFILVDDKGIHIKFIAESDSDAILWVSALREAIELEEENAKRKQQEVPLIQL